jgi:hypothetical protein
MHFEKDLSLFDFSKIEEPLFIDLAIRRNPELFTYFLRYMLGLEIDSVEYKKLKTRFIQGGYLKSGYFRALSDVDDYWKKYRTAIRQYKLSGYDGVSFLLKKLIENRQKLYYQSDGLDMEITKEEIDKFKESEKRRNGSMRRKK